ncbi:MAG: DUF6702 family protein [Myxococcota bacterium]
MMTLRGVSLLVVLLLAFGHTQFAHAHPLRLSLSQIEYSSTAQRLTVSLRLFLQDVREALLFDPDNTDLAFCTPKEAARAETLLMTYLNEFFRLQVNGRKVDLEIKAKALSGEGPNTALAVSFEIVQEEPLKSLEIYNAVFTDLFFDQSNVVYVHVDDDNKSLMLNKKTPSHTLTF